MDAETTSQACNRHCRMTGDVVFRAARPSRPLRVPVAML